MNKEDAAKNSGGVAVNSPLTALARRELDALAADVLEVCKLRGWSLHWTHRGAYLHLEASELIEAVRGKRGNVLQEAGDVLLVLMSITETRGIPFSNVVEQARSTVSELRTKPHYAAEEWATEYDATTDAMFDNFLRTDPDVQKVLQEKARGK